MTRLQRHFTRTLRVGNFLQNKEVFDISDVLIIGGGPAGLQAAMSLGRLGRSATIFDSRVYRNDGTHEMHDVLGHDGQNPEMFRRFVRLELERYPSITYSPIKIETIFRNSDNRTFTAIDSTGASYRGRRVVLATGLVDILPEIEGLREIWGSGAFWCMWCDLYEKINGPIAFWGMNGVYSALNAQKVKRNNFTVLTNGLDPHVNLMEMSATTNLRLDKFIKEDHVQFDDRKVKNFTFVDSMAKDSSIRANFVDGGEAIFKGLLIETTTIPHGNLHLQLGVDIDPATGSILTKSRFGDTNVNGVYVIGDAGSIGTNILIAETSGKAASVYLVKSLTAEEYSS